jgi:hypothetical protein
MGADVPFNGWDQHFDNVSAGKLMKNVGKPSRLASDRNLRSARSMMAVEPRGGEAVSQLARGAYLECLD